MIGMAKAMQIRHMPNILSTVIVSPLVTIYTIE